MTELNKRAWGEPLVSATLRTLPEDFLVDEHLDLPSDDNEARAHLWVQVQKRERNTQDVAKRLADVTGSAVRDLGFAGLKDRRAVTRQWFSLPVEAVVSVPGITVTDEPDDVLAALRKLLLHKAGCEGITLLACAWRSRKLRRGAHAGNRFDITLRDVQALGDVDALEQRLAERVARLHRDGFPNAFGPQRFGPGGRNLVLARRLFAAGTRLPRVKGQRQRHERGMLFSAARSAMFNRVLDQRLTDATWLHALEGEPLILAGSNSRFVPETVDDTLRERLDQADLSTSGPMVGRGDKRGNEDARGECAALESRVLADEAPLIAGLAAAGVEAGRRPLRATATDIVLTQEDEATWRLRVTLASGVFATSLLKEIGDCQDAVTGAVALSSSGVRAE